VPHDGVPGGAFVGHPDCQPGCAPSCTGPPIDPGLPYDIPKGPNDCEPCLTWNPQMIGGGAGISQVRVLAGSLADATRVTLPAVPGTTVRGNVLSATGGGRLLIDGGTVFLRTPAGTITRIILPDATRGVYVPGGVAVVRTTVVPVERGPIKIAENESPRPMDRVFATWDYFHNVNHFNVQLHRETIGFEKTFLDGNASIGLRAPAFEMDGGGQSRGGLNDLSVVLKYAVVNDPCSGNVVSAGVMATAPTGPAFTAFDGTTVHSTLVQPFVGGVWNNGYFYVQGFSSAAVPIERRDVLVLLNDVGLGYYAYLSCEESWLEFVVPTIEAHVNTPITHRDKNAAYYGVDEIELTAGVHLGIGPHGVLTFGASRPLSSPRPYDYELIAQFNLRY
jgi:hypothetical protein